MLKLVIAAGLLAACAGCNTVAGFGKDLQTVGGVVAGTAEGARAGTTSSPSTTPCQADAQGRVPATC